MCLDSLEEKQYPEPEWYLPLGAGSWGPMAAAPEPPNGRILGIYRYFRTKCRHNVEFMGFPEWYLPLEAGSWGPTAAAPEPPNGRIPCIYRYFGTECRQIVEFMAFGACQTPQARRPWRTSQAQTVGEFWWLNPNRQ